MVAGDVIPRLYRDGYPDIHVTNDFNNHIFYVNNRDGTFDRQVLARSTNRNGMSSEVVEFSGTVTSIYLSLISITVTQIPSMLEGQKETIFFCIGVTGLS